MIALKKSVLAGMVIFLSFISQPAWTGHGNSKCTQPQGQPRQTQEQPDREVNPSQLETQSNPDDLPDLDEEWKETENDFKKPETFVVLPTPPETPQPPLPSPETLPIEQWCLPKYFAWITEENIRIQQCIQHLQRQHNRGMQDIGWTLHELRALDQLLKNVEYMHIRMLIRNRTPQFAESVPQLREPSQSSVTLSAKDSSDMLDKILDEGLQDDTPKHQNDQPILRKLFQPMNVVIDSNGIPSLQLPGTSSSTTQETRAESHPKFQPASECQTQGTILGHGRTSATA